MLGKIIDFIYRTNGVKTNYQQKHLSEKVLIASGCKAITTTSNQDIKHGVNWATSRRAVLLLTDKNLVCGNWTIPLENISTAVLVSFSTILGKGQVLKIETKDAAHYQFGMMRNTAWENQGVLPLSVKKGKVGYTLISVLARVFLVLWICYHLYRYFR